MLYINHAHEIRERGALKKTIGGRVYDTSTAKKVGESSNGPVTQSLYRKRSGSMFLETRVSGIGGFEKLEPLDYSDACEWARSRLGIDLDRPPSQGSGGRGVYFKFDEAVYAKLQRAASVRGVPKTKIVEELILENL